MNITIVYYDQSCPIDTIPKVVREAQKAVGEESKVIAVPKNYDILLDCSIDQLLSVRSIIDTAISAKINSEVTSEYMN